MPDKKPAAAAKPKAASTSKDGKSAKAPNNTQYAKDSSFQSDLISGLNADNYEQFVNDTNIALIMFYDNSASDSAWSRGEFVQAAENTVRERHVYAAVDCEKNRSICDNANSYPYYKLFSQGHWVATETNAKQFTNRTMKTYVENCPNHEETYPPEEKVCLLNKKISPK